MVDGEKEVVSVVVVGVVEVRLFVFCCIFDDGDVSVFFCFLIGRCNDMFINSSSSPSLSNIALLFFIASASSLFLRILSRCVAVNVDGGLRLVLTFRFTVVAFFLYTDVSAAVNVFVLAC